MYTINKNTEYISIIRVIHISCFLYSSKKSAKHVLFFISKGILHQISIALCFIILALEFERAFGKANCRSLSERLSLHNQEEIEHCNVDSSFI